MLRKIILSSIFIAATPICITNAMELKFDWSDLELCNTGSMKIVPSPIFTVTDIPDTTATLQFRLVDLDHPDFPHGNGKVSYEPGLETI